MLKPGILCLLAFTVQQAGEDAAVLSGAGGGFVNFWGILLRQFFTAQADLSAFLDDLAAHDASLFGKSGYTHIYSL